MPRPKWQEKVTRESCFFMAFWQYQFIFSCVLSGGKKDCFSTTFSFPISPHLQTHNQSAHQSWILLPVKWRTCFPFIIKLYGLVAKTTCFGVNGIWVWFETNYLNSLRVHFLLFKMGVWASLVVQWLRICLPMRGTRVRALVWEDPTCCGATRPVSHSCWACVSGACAPQQERPR